MAKRNGGIPLIHNGRVVYKHEVQVRMNLTRAQGEEADLSGAFAPGVILEEAHLKNADLSNAILVDANLRGANLEGADVEGAHLLGADLRGANVKGVNKRHLNDAMRRSPSP